MFGMFGMVGMVGTVGVVSVVGVATVLRMVNMVKHCPNQNCPGLARDGLVAEFVESLSECIDCGTRLVRGPSHDDPDPALEYHDLKTVFIAANATEGHIVASVLEAEGIPFYLKGEMLQGGVGELPALDYQVEIQVPIEREDRARELVLRFEGRGAVRSVDGLRG